MMDHRYFKQLFDKTYMPLCMYALRILGDTDAADDAVQQAFVSVWERVAAGGGIENPRAYLYRAVRNEALHILPSDLREKLDTAPEVTDECMDTSERDAALWKAVDSLPTRCREVFLAAKRDGLTHAEIAEDMGISEKTVEAQITKALRRLREALHPYAIRHTAPFFLPFL